MKKIFIGKNDDPARVVENILQENEKSIVLVIPKFSKLSDSVSNFHLLKREAEADGKNLLIESIDDDALALAAAAKIPGVNPFLSGRKRNMSDIVSPSETSPAGDADTSSVSVSTESPVLASSKTKSADDVQPEKSEEVEVDFTARDRRGLRQIFRSRRLIRFAVAGAVAIPVLWAAVSYAIPSVSVNLTLKKNNWNFSEPVTAVVGLSAADYASRRLPAETFTDQKSVTVTQLATGARKVERRAGGDVTIYNAFSSAAQPLVANTRLLTPEGLIFRLTEKITVPGAKIEQGKIIPSSVSARVIANQAGDKYNVGPVSRFSIPGFQGTSKYEGFYAASSAPIAGGFIGTAAYPVESDIKTATDKLKTLLADAVSLSIGNLPSNFVVIDGASEVKYSQPVVDDAVDDSKNFKVLGEASIKVLAFSATELNSLLNFAAADNFGFAVNLNDADIFYSAPAADFSAGTLRFTPSVALTATRAVNTEALISEIIGLPADALKDYIVNLSGIESARISFWPLWVDKVPDNPDKIRVVADY